MRIREVTMPTVQAVECPHCHFVNYVDLERLLQQRGVFYKGVGEGVRAVRLHCSNCGRSFVVEMPPEVQDERSP